MQTYKQICQRTLFCDESSPPLCRVSVFALCSPPEANLKRSNTEPSTKSVATQTRCKNTTTSLRPKAPPQKNQKKIFALTQIPKWLSRSPRPTSPTRPTGRTSQTCQTSPTNSHKLPHPQLVPAALQCYSATVQKHLHPPIMQTRRQRQYSTIVLILWR